MSYYIIEKEFEHNGMKCVVIFSKNGYRCGYVGIPKEHPLYGRGCDDRLEINKKDIEGKKVSGIFPLLGCLIDSDDRVRIEAYFECHGGITYAGGGENSAYPIPSDLWWFGFDCAHYEDAEDLDLAMKYFPEHAREIAVIKYVKDMFPIDSFEVRKLDYVEEQCRELADQLASFGKEEK